MLVNYNSLKRLIDFDKSKEFKIIVTIENDQNQNDDKFVVSKQTKVVIKTSINKARVISANIDQSYQNDQSIDQYEIKLSNLTEKNKTQKVVQIFQLLLNSIGKEVTVSPDIQNIFMLIACQLGESEIQMDQRIKKIEILSYYKDNKINIDGITRYRITAGNNNDEQYRYDLNNLFKYDTENICDFYYKYYQHDKLDKRLNERYIEFDFKEDKIKIATVRIETNDFYYKDKSLKIVGSNDRTTWDTLVYCNDNAKLRNSRGGNQNITLEFTNTRNYYQYIRYIEIDSTNQSGIKIMQIKNFEFIGDIITQQNNNEVNNYTHNDDVIMDYSELFMID